MIWPFAKKPAPPADARNWNENWEIGDTAECVIEFDDWHPDMPPWDRLAKGSQWTVIGFVDGIANLCPRRCYFLTLQGLNYNYECTAFRKVQPTSQAQETSIGEKILKAKPAPDIKRSKPAKAPQVQA